MQELKSASSTGKVPSISEKVIDLNILATAVGSTLYTVEAKLFGVRPLDPEDKGEPSNIDDVLYLIKMKLSELQDLAISISQRL
jgi:hypothetical protein